MQNTITSNKKNTVNGLQSNQSGYMTQNGWVISAQKNESKTCYKDYCLKCGKLKSAHGGFFGTSCPK